MPGFMEAFRRVLETDMLYSILVYIIAISLGSMYIFLAIIGFVLCGVIVLLTIAHLKDNRKLRLAGKIANVALTIIAFINIFADNLYFNDFIFSS